ncbi:MAG: ATP-binding protein [Polyangiaceae bacterium]
MVGSDPRILIGRFGREPGLQHNLATTLSFASAAVTLSVAMMAARLGRGPAPHFRYAALASLWGALFCVTDIVVAGGMSETLTVWACRANVLFALLHASAWLLFLAAWDQRPLRRFERQVVTASIVGGVAALVPGFAFSAPLTMRTLPSLGLAYAEPAIGPLAVPLLAVAFVAQVLAAMAARRVARAGPEARLVSVSLALFTVVGMVDLATGLHLTTLPYVADPAIALTCLSVAAVVVAEAAASASRSNDLERARATLAEREHLVSLGQLAAVVAHEVRNPVAIIFGAVANLRREPTSDDRATLLGIIEDEAERLKRLAARLLDAVRPFELQYSRQSAATVVRAAVSHVTASAAVDTKEIELVGAMNDELDCDRVLLEQAIANLVQNALIADGRRGPVRVVATVENGASPTLAVTVHDDGSGVPEMARSRLFTPFFTTRPTGTGLGLVLVQRIARAHGGSVVHEAPTEGGARFVLRVPMRGAAATDSGARDG